MNLCTYIHFLNFYFFVIAHHIMTHFQISRNIMYIYISEFYFEIYIVGMAEAFRVYDPRDAKNVIKHKKFYYFISWSKQISGSGLAEFLYSFTSFASISLI